MPTAVSRRVLAVVSALALGLAGTLVALPAAAAPSVDPAPSSPAAAALLTDRTPELGWTAAQSDFPNTLRYRVEVRSGGSIVRFGAGVTDTVWSPLLPLPDGDYTWRVRGIDRIASEGPWSAESSFTVDTTAPDLTLTAPVSGTFGGGGVTVAGTVSDAHPGTVTLTDNGVVAGTDSSGSSTFSFTITPSSGSHTLEVTAVDAAGNSDAGSTASVVVSVDADAPNVAIISPSNGSYVKLGSLVEFHATADDANRFSWNGRLDAAGIPGAYAYLATGPVVYQTSIATSGWLDASSHTLTFATRDEFDQPSSVTSTVIADGSAPVVTFDAPASNSAHAGILTVSGDVVDAGSGVATLDVRVRAADSEGVCNGPAERFPVTVGSDGSWTIDIDTTAFADGVYCVISHAVDNVGNGNGQSTRLRGIEFDNTAPATPSTIFPAGFTLAADSFRWSAVGDPNGVTYQVVLGGHPNTTDGRLNDGVDIALDDPTATSQAYPFATGPLQWQVRAVDGLGNASPWSSPTGAQVIGIPEIVYPTPGLEFASTSLTAQWTPSFGVGGVARYEVEYGLDRDHDGTLAYEYRTVAGPFSWTGDLVSRTQSFTSGYEGPLTIRVRAVYVIPIGGSTLGPWSDPAVSYLRDTGKPTIVIDAPTAGSAFTAGVAIPVTVTGTDPAGISRLVANLYAADGSTFLGPIGSTPPTGALGTSATRTWSIPAGLAEGTYVIRASAKDAAGKTTATSMPFVIDSTRPTITIDAPASGMVLNSNVTVTVTGLDPNGIASIAANLYNASNTGALLRNIGSSTAPTGVTSHSATWVIPVSWFPSDGTYTIRAGGFDVAGNNRTVTSTFTVDTTAPAAPQPINPQNGLIQANDAPLLDWNPVADAASYEVRTATSPGRTPNANDGELNGSDAVTLPSVTDSALQLSGVGEGWLWWQVRAVDAVGNTGPWSDIWATGVDTVAPTVSLLAPADGATLTTRDFSLTWSSSESGVTYDVQSSLDPTVDPATGALASTIDTVTQAPAFLDLVGVPDQVYFWQVRATDAAGNVGSWTVPFEVTVDADVDTELPTGSPGDGGTGTGTPGTPAGQGAASTQLTTFALTDTDEEPASDDSESGSEESTDDEESNGAEAASDAQPAGFDAGLMTLLIALFAALLLLIALLLFWLRRRSQEN